MPNNRIFVVIPAAGTGTRMGNDLPKQYLNINDDNQTVLSKVLEAIFQSVEVEKAIIAIAPGDSRFYDSVASFRTRCFSVTGGAQRIFSVFNCLNHLEGEAAEDDWILVHDAARPCVRREDIRNLMETIKDSSVGGILGVPINDTLKLCEGGDVLETLDRKKIWRAMTPQVFRFKILRNALKLAIEGGYVFTDEAQAVESSGHLVKVILGHHDNIKITYADDLKLARFFLAAQDAV